MFEILTPNKAAAYLGISVPTLRSWHSAKIGPACLEYPLTPNPGKTQKSTFRTRYRRADLDEFMAKYHVQQKPLRDHFDRMAEVADRLRTVGTKPPPLTETQWALAAPFAPKPHNVPTSPSRRVVLEAVLWLAWTGRYWDELPPEILRGHAKSVIKNAANCWLRRGHWVKIFGALAADPDFQYRMSVRTVIEGTGRDRNKLENYHGLELAASTLAGNQAARAAYRQPKRHGKPFTGTAKGKDPGGHRP